MNFIDDLIFFLLHEMLNEYNVFKGVDHCFFLGKFGSIFGKFGSIFGKFGSIFGNLGSIFGKFGSKLGIFRTIFGHISVDFWVIFCRF